MKSGKVVTPANKNPELKICPLIGDQGGKAHFLGSFFILTRISKKGVSKSCVRVRIFNSGGFLLSLLKNGTLT